MSLTAGKAIKAVLHNKDIAELLSEDKEIFGIYEPAYEFITEYYGKYQSVPTTTILEEKFGDDLFDTVPDTDGASRHYLNELRDEYLRANINDLILKVSRNIDRHAPAAVLDRIASTVSDLAKHSTRTEDVDVMDVDKALESFKKAREASEDGVLGVKTGIDVWDQYVPTGALPGMNVVLIGYSGKGKSWVADLLAVNAYLQGKKVLFISLEMSAEQQRARMWSIANQGKFLMSDLQRGNVVESEVKKFGTDRLNTGGKLMVSAIDGVTDVTPNIIRAKIERYQPDVVFVDYMQLMMDNSRTKDMTPRMLNLSKEMKRLAVSANVPIYNISAVTDDEGKKRNSPPTIAQIAWSKGIEYDADLVVAVHRYDQTDILELACRKNRNGEMFNLQFLIDLSRGVFEPRLEDDEDD